MQITAVIVTYNRKELLVNCLKAVWEQTVALEHILIVDNASTDGTVEYLDSEGWLSQSQISLLCLENNIGGAGGFANGMKHAMKQGAEWLWLMDDDGVPEKNCLEKLVKVSAEKKLGAISPLQVDINDHSRPAFPIFSPSRSFIEKLPYEHEMSIPFTPNEANLFNGILISSDSIEKVGLPRVELFIRGDEVDYTLRMKKANIKFGTLLDCYFYHPSDKGERQRVFFGLFNARDANNDFKNYYLFRNKALAFKESNKCWLIPFDAVRYVYYFIFFKKFDFHGLSVWLKATKDGFLGKLGRHPMY